MLQRSNIFIALGLAVIITLIVYSSTIETVLENAVGIMTRQQFIDKFSSAIQSASKGTGLYPSVMMAQAILESGNGNSSLTKLYNNFFGIKADSSWTGAKVLMPTTEVINGVSESINDYFRSYKSPLDSFKDRIKFLQGFSRYKNLFTATTPEQQATELQQDGYATDPNYPTKLINLINQYNLKSLDA